MTRVRCLRYVVTIVAALAMCQTTSRAGPASSDATIEANCKQYFHDACSEAMGRWVPTFGESNAWWDHATHVDRTDGFIDGFARQPSKELVGNFGPADGTPFVYGSAGPPKGRAVYDLTHRIAFFDQGCCSWHDVVAAAEVPAPPKRVTTRDLRAIRTIRGIRLWQTKAEVTRIYGAATSQTVAGHRGVTVLAYTTWRPRNEVKSVPPCGQFENFFFRRDRLVLIQLGDGC